MMSTKQNNNARQTKAATSSRSPKGGFTLIEMLLTLAIIAIVSAFAWPVLQKPLANRRLHSAADEVRSGWCKARVQAMRSGHVYAFRYQIGGDHFRTDPENTSATLSDGLQTEMANASEDEYRMDSEDASEMDDKVLPDGLTFLADEHDDETADALAAAEAGAAMGADGWSEPILFYPDGTASDVRVRIGNEESGVVQLSLRGITGTATVADVDQSVE